MMRSMLPVDAPSDQLMFLSVLTVAAVHDQMGEIFTASAHGKSSEKLLED
jgi:hypothetical protein